MCVKTTGAGAAGRVRERTRGRGRRKTEPVTHTSGAERRAVRTMPSGGSPWNARMHRRAAGVACPRAEGQGCNGEEASERARGETRSGSDGEVGEKERQTEPASRPTDRQGGTQGVCLCVCARGLMIRVYHSRGVYRRPCERDRAR